jgi:hypothetical protein
MPHFSVTNLWLLLPGRAGVTFFLQRPLTGRHCSAPLRESKPLRGFDFTEFCFAKHIIPVPGPACALLKNPAVF